MTRQQRQIPVADVPKWELTDDTLRTASGGVSLPLTSANAGVLGGKISVARPGRPLPAGGAGLPASERRTCPRMAQLVYRLKQKLAVRLSPAKPFPDCRGLSSQAICQRRPQSSAEMHTLHVNLLLQCLQALRDLVLAGGEPEGQIVVAGKVDRALQRQCRILHPGRIRIEWRHSHIQNTLFWAKRVLSFVGIVVPTAQGSMVPIDSTNAGITGNLSEHT